MDQFTRNLERANKYRYSHFQSLVGQNEKKQHIKSYFKSTGFVWLLPVLVNIKAIQVVMQNNPLNLAKFTLASVGSVALALYYDSISRKNLEENIKRVDRRLPNPVQLQLEYARDLEIFKRISKN